jgi:hypothetical protein
LKLCEDPARVAEFLEMERRAQGKGQLGRERPEKPIGRGRQVPYFLRPAAGPAAAGEIRMISHPTP